MIRGTGYVGDIRGTGYVGDIRGTGYVGDIRGTGCRGHQGTSGYIVYVCVCVHVCVHDVCRYLIMIVCDAFISSTDSALGQCRMATRH